MLSVLFKDAATYNVTRAPVEPEIRLQATTGKLGNWTTPIPVRIRSKIVPLSLSRNRRIKMKKKKKKGDSRFWSP